LTVTVAFNENMPIAGTGKSGNTIFFTASPEFYEIDAASSPLEVLR